MKLPVLIKRLREIESHYGEDFSVDLLMEINNPNTTTGWCQYQYPLQDIAVSKKFKTVILIRENEMEQTK